MKGIEWTVRMQGFKQVESREQTKVRSGRLVGEFSQVPGVHYKRT